MRVIRRKEEMVRGGGRGVEEIVLLEDGFCGEGGCVSREDELDSGAEGLLDEGGEERIVSASEEGGVDGLGTEVAEVVFDDELGGWVRMEVFFDERDEERARNRKYVERWVVGQELRLQLPRTDRAECTKYSYPFGFCGDK